MPLVTKDKMGNSQPFTGDLSKANPDPMGYLDIIGASYRQDNMVTTYVSEESGLPSVNRAAAYDVLNPEATKIDYISKAMDDNIDEEYLSKFNNVRTNSEYSALKMQINKEKSDKELISKADTSTQILAGLTAGITDLDPLMLLPAVKLANTTRKTVNIAADASKFAVAGGVSGGVSESVAQATQQTRDEDEYKYSIIGGAVLGGMLGGAASAFRKSPIDIKKLEEDLGRAVLNDGDLYGSSSASAAEAKKTTLEEEGIAGGGLAKGIANIAAKDKLLIDMPVTQGLTSQSKIMRQVTQSLAETAGMRISKAEKGIAVADGQASIESLNKIARGAVIEANEIAQDLHIKMRLGRKRKMGDVTRLEVQDAFNKNNMSYRDFQREVGVAMRNNDEHQIPEVAQAAKTYRSKVLEPLNKEAVELGLLPEGVPPEGAASYFTRIYDIDKITRDPLKFDDITFKWLKDEQFKKATIQDELEPLLKRYDANKDDLELKEQIIDIVSRWQGKSNKDLKKALQAEAKGKTLDDALNSAIKKIMATDTRLIDADLMSLASEIRSRIISTPDGRLPYDKNMRVDGQGRVSSQGFLDDVNKPGMFKGRAFAIPDNMISDFTINDADQVISGYVKRVKPYMNMHRRFNGDTELKGVMKDMESEKNDLIRKAKTPKEREKIEKKYQKDIRSLVALRQRALGRDFIASDPTHGGARVSRALRTLNVVTLLGGMTISAIPDLGNLILLGSKPIKKTTGNLVKSMLAGNQKIVWDKMKELRYAGVVAEIISNDRIMQMGDVADDVQARTKFERGLDFAGDKFGIASLMAPWNEMLKQFAAITTEATIYDLAKKASKGAASKEDMVVLSNNRIDKDMAKRIVGQYEKYGDMERELPLMNAGDWDDLEAKGAFLSALTEEVDRIILTPGYNKSIHMNSSELKKTIWQFKSFFSEATTKMLIRGVQDWRDLKMAGSIIATTGLGMMVYAFKTKQAGKELSDNPAIWIIEGLDRSGRLGFLMEINNIMEKAAGVGLRPAVGGGVSSRFASRSARDSLFGPTLGQIDNLARIARVFGTQEVNEGDVNAILRMIPGQNLPYLAPVKNKAKEELFDLLR
jgi:hypothetical protein